MPAAPTVSVVVPTFRRPAGVRRAVQSLLDQDLPHDRYEVIVVDSSPDTGNQLVVEELARHSAPAVRFFRKLPEGPGPSRNLGVREARGEFIAFMDSDCQATPGWLRAGLAAFAEGVGMVQGKTIPERGVPLGVFTHYIRVERESFLYETANMFYRKSALLQSGGFPADLRPLSETPVGGEDVHVAWTVKRNGWASRFAEEAVVMHEVVPIKSWEWVVIRRLFIYPRLTKAFPEIRRFLFARYFLDRNHALLVAGLIGLALAWWNPLSSLLLLPYLYARAAEPSRTLTGVLRPVRALVYAARDVVSLGLLIAGSIRFRSLVL